MPLYHDGTAPWDIGPPQQPIVGLASEGGIAGAVFGRGTGENVIFLASLGFSIVDVDVAERSLAIAADSRILDNREAC